MLKEEVKISMAIVGPGTKNKWPEQFQPIILQYCIVKI